MGNGYALAKTLNEEHDVERALKLSEDRYRWISGRTQDWSLSLDAITTKWPNSLSYVRRAGSCHSMFECAPRAMPMNALRPAALLSAKTGTEDLVGPFAVAHHWRALASIINAINVHAARTNHPVDVIDAHVAALRLDLVPTE
jgi:hypothetical protein